MIAVGLFMILWFVFIALGLVWCVINHMELSAGQIADIWLKCDVVYSLVVGWILAAVVVLLVYVIKTSDYNKGMNSEKK